MHICVFSVLGISKKAETWGGVQTHTKNLIDLLVKDGHVVSCITGSGEKIKNNSLSIIPVGRRYNGRTDKFWFGKARETFLDIHKNNPVDCAISEGGGARELLNLMRYYQIPVVAFVHSLSMHYFYNKWQEVDCLHALKSYVLRTLPRIIYEMFFFDINFLEPVTSI